MLWGEKKGVKRPFDILAVVKTRRNPLKVLYSM